MHACGIQSGATAILGGTSLEWMRHRSRQPDPDGQQAMVAMVTSGLPHITLWRFLFWIPALLLPLYVLLQVFGQPYGWLDKTQQESPELAAPLCLVDLERDCAVDLFQAERGTSLWHSWGDEELLRRAGSTASSYAELLEDGQPVSYLAQLQRRGSWNKSDAGRQGLEIAANYVQHYARSTHKEYCRMHWDGVQGAESWPIPVRPKIAFMFLTMGTMPFARLWDTFFAGNEHLFNVYVHASPFPDVSTFGRQYKHFWGRLIPSGTTARGTASLISAARRLLANALLDDPLNEYFALLSEHCIPVRGFQHVYRVLTSSNKSYVQQTREVGNLWRRYTVRGDTVMLPEIHYNQFYQGSQFFVLVRKHAILFARDTKYWKKFNLPCREHLACFPEEHYFPTVLAIEDREGTSNHSLTFVDWSRSKTTHPRTFRKDEVTKQLVTFLQYYRGGMFLFARKFADASIDALMAISADLLRN